MCPPHAHTDCCRCSPDRRSHDAWSVPANCPCPRRAAQSGSIAPPLLSIRLQIIISGLCRRTCVSVCVRVCVPECVNWFFAGTCGGSQRSEKGHRASQFQVCCTYPCAHNTLDYALEIICLVPRVRTQMTQHCCACVWARARALNTLCKHPPEWIYKEQKKSKWARRKRRTMAECPYIQRMYTLYGNKPREGTKLNIETVTRRLRIVLFSVDFCWVLVIRTRANMCKLT